MTAVYEEPFLVGIDIGSTTTKIAVLAGSEREIIYSIIRDITRDRWRVSA